MIGDSYINNGKLLSKPKLYSKGPMPSNLRNSFSGSKKINQIIIKLSKNIKMGYPKPKSPP